MLGQDPDQPIELDRPLRHKQPIAVVGGVSFDAIRCPADGIRAIKIEIALIQPEEESLAVTQELSLTAVAAATGAHVVHQGAALLIKLQTAGTRAGPPALTGISAVLPTLDQALANAQSHLPLGGGQWPEGFADRQPIGPVDGAGGTGTAAVPVSGEQELVALTLVGPLEAERTKVKALSQLISEAGQLGGRESHVAIGA